MRVKDEAELSALLAWGAARVAGSKAAMPGAGKAKKPQVGKLYGENLRLVLPFKLPTWNALLAMDHWQRRRVREWIKKQVSACIQSGSVSQTQMGLVLRLRLTDSCLQEYSQMITPNSSRKLRSRKKSLAPKKP